MASCGKLTRLHHVHPATLAAIAAAAEEHPDVRAVHSARRRGAGEQRQRIARRDRGREVKVRLHRSDEITPRESCASNGHDNPRSRSVCPPPRPAERRPDAVALSTASSAAYVRDVCLERPCYDSE